MHFVWYNRENRPELLAASPPPPVLSLSLPLCLSQLHQRAVRSSLWTAANWEPVLLLWDWYYSVPGLRPSQRAALRSCTSPCCGLSTWRKSLPRLRHFHSTRRSRKGGGGWLRPGRNCVEQIAGNFCDIFLCLLVDMVDLSFVLC